VRVNLDAGSPSDTTSYLSSNGYIGSLQSYTFTTDAATRSVLRKPDGSPVTLADVDAADTTSGLYGSSCKRADIRNWLRAASHVRFSAYDGAKKRTIDIPIPWKLMDGASKGNPLSSLTLKDQQIKDGITYGSGLSIEMDQTYKIEDASGGAFTADANGTFLANADCSAAVKGATLYTALYRPAYISWLFLGKYQSADAAKPNYTTDTSLAGITSSSMRSTRLWSGARVT
jgi:hypothetical protein